MGAAVVATIVTGVLTGAGLTLAFADGDGLATANGERAAATGAPAGVAAFRWPPWAAADVGTAGVLWSLTGIGPDVTGDVVLGGVAPGTGAAGGRFTATGAAFGTVGVDVGTADSGLGATGTDG